MIGQEGLKSPRMKWNNGHDDYLGGVGKHRRRGNELNQAKRHHLLQKRHPSLASVEAPNTPTLTSALIYLSILSDQQVNEVIGKDGAKGADSASLTSPRVE
eukprot:SAG11_NODE_19529_length_464_cov_3.079452_1_plen_100_part_01